MGNFAEEFIAGHRAGTEALRAKKSEELAQQRLDLEKQWHQQEAKWLDLQQKIAVHQANVNQAHSMGMLRTGEEEPEPTALPEGQAGPPAPVARQPVMIPGAINPETGEEGPATPFMPRSRQQMMSEAAQGAELTGLAQRRANELQEPFTASIGGANVNLPAGTPKEAIGPSITGAAGIKEAGIRSAVAANDPMRLLLARSLGQGGAGGGAGAEGGGGGGRVQLPRFFEPGHKVTSLGNEFFDKTQFSGKMADGGAAVASSAGLPVFGKDEVGTIRELETARSNQAAMLDQLEPFLPKDATGRLLVGPENKLSQILQSEPALAAFNSWRASAIQQLRAMAGSRGLRINQAEVKLATENDIPEITDTWATAQQKVKNVATMLDSQESALFGKRANPPAGSEKKAAAKTTGQSGGITHRYNKATGKLEAVSP